MHPDEQKALAGYECSGRVNGVGAGSEVAGPGTVHKHSNPLLRHDIPRPLFNTISWVFSERFE